LALWGGEEQGLLGSQAHVAGSYGTAESPRFAHSSVAGYFNLDSGTGRIRSLTVFGPQEAADVLSQIVAPFADIGVTGAVATRSRRLCCSDYTSFWAAGLPGITLIQDPIEYSASWHSNLDSFERIVEDDLKQAAQVVASAVYHLSVRDLPLPRFAPSEMPLPAGTAASDHLR
jgi:Zn-dependent M28 family amino/carboxypeptidase